MRGENKGLVIFYKGNYILPHKADCASISEIWQDPEPKGFNFVFQGGKTRLERVSEPCSATRILSTKVSKLRPELVEGGAGGRTGDDFSAIIDS